MRRSAWTRIATTLFMAAGVASCGGATTIGASGPDASVDGSTGGMDGSIATGGTGGTGAAGGTGATGGTGGSSGVCSGVSCNAPAQCLNGKCRCPGSERYCNATCVNTQTDLLNCGACNHGCQTGEDCIKGKCEPQGNCNAAFCPDLGYGTPCCLSPSGPCGTNTGSGCTAPAIDAGP